MSDPLTGDPRFIQQLEAIPRLTAPGGPFEVVVQDVLGQPMAVFRERQHSLREVLTAASRFGDADCYVFEGGRRFTHAQLQRQAASVAKALRERHGLGKGDRVAICAANCPEWLLTFWAAASSGIVIVAMNGWATGSEMRYALELSEPSLLIIDEKRLARIDGDPGLPTVVIEQDFAAWLDDPDAPAIPLPATPIAEDDPFILIFTSGTTGRPKAAVLSHRSVIAYLMLQSFLGGLGLASSGRTAAAGPPPTRLAPFPLFHVSGMSSAVSSVMNGIKSVWPTGRFDPARVVALTLEEDVSIWGGATTHVSRLIDAPETRLLPPDQIKQISVGGSATTPELIRRVEAAFPHLAGTMSTGYGSTESGLISWAPNWMLRVAPDCVGTVLPTNEVRITDDSGAVVPPGAEGNIEMRGPASMVGYWRNEQATAQTLLPGRWVRTGDFGRYRDDALFIVSRRQDLIIRGGENIYPAEIEYRIDEHPDVLESAVFAIPDAEFGHQPKAVVIIRPDAKVTVEEIREFCTQTLAYYKVPVEFEIRTEPLPRNATGKVMKHLVASSAATGLIQEDA
ncbi:MAG TPA: class I adenylate-forming enzyme family protein [Frankiaceae bacterium]|jgi:acyl-CoA synthetase (AMP-forming)/AMP-acid ligase II|nr:class I adenylate-forming enzyme family protein [Frankiaceae bacterium]